MNASPSSKRIKLDPPEDDQNEKHTDLDDLEREHCTICLQSFLDRTIIPVCAHEFCFECILLWSGQSRKCPLCSRSFDDSYLIHHIRSQYDYQKHYLLPQRSSPPPLTGESRATVLRNTRRERQWGRRQRREREEADQLERAIARRRWIYQHHLYAKHVASNPYTRYRPFPTSAQFAASPDLISRMTIFLRRELRVWPNLDVEFLTTYTISLMKSIDIRSESAVKLLSEFLDLDTPYVAGARHVNAEHFAHEIYSYLRSPYRDLNTYDQTAQYDTPPEILPPQEIERGSRWSAEPSPLRRSRSWSNSRYQSPALQRENNVVRSPVARHDNGSSTHVRREDKSNYSHGSNRSPRGREDQDFRNRPSDRRHSLPDGVQDPLRNGHPEVSYSQPPDPDVLAENKDNRFPTQSYFQGDEGKNQTMEDVEDSAAAVDTPKVIAFQGDDSMAALAANKAGVSHLIHGLPEATDDKVTYYVDNEVRGGSSANTQLSRKCSAGPSVHLHPRNRTLSASIQAYLSRPAVPWHPPKKRPVSGDEQPTRTSDAGMTTDTRPRLLLRLTDDGLAIGKSPSPLKETVERTTDSVSTSDDDSTSKQEQPTHACRFRSPCVFSSNRASFAGTTHANGESRTDDGRTLSSHANWKIDRRSSLGLPPEPSITPLTRETEPSTSAVRLLSGVDDTLDGHTQDTSSLITGEERPGCEDNLKAVGDEALRLEPDPDTTVMSAGSGCRDSGSAPTWTARSDVSTTDVRPDISALEMRLRARARVRVRLAAIKGAAGA